MKPTIHYQKFKGYTANPTLLFIHGAGGRLENWPAAWRNGRILATPQQRWLTDYSRLFIDLPGHAHSAPLSHTTITAYAKALWHFIESQTLTQLVLVGHSMAGAIAQQMALQPPPHLAGRLTGLILIGTGAHMPVSDHILNGLLNDFTATVSLITKFSWHRQASPLYKTVAQQHLLATPPTIVHGDFLACNQFDSREQLPHIHTHTLIIGGDKDKMMPPANSHFLADHIPHTQLHLIKEAGHFMMVEKASLVAQCIVDFLKQCKLNREG